MSDAGEHKIADTGEGEDRLTMSDIFSRMGTAWGTLARQTIGKYLKKYINRVQFISSDSDQDNFKRILFNESLKTYCSGNDSYIHAEIFHIMDNLLITNENFPALLVLFLNINNGMSHCSIDNLEIKAIKYFIILCLMNKASHLTKIKKKHIDIFIAMIYFGDSDFFKKSLAVKKDVITHFELSMYFQILLSISDQIAVDFMVVILEMFSGKMIKSAYDIYRGCRNKEGEEAKTFLEFKLLSGNFALRARQRFFPYYPDLKTVMLNKIENEIKSDEKSGSTVSLSAIFSESSGSGSNDTLASNDQSRGSADSLTSGLN